VHIDKLEPLIQLAFDCRSSGKSGLKFPLNHAGPTAIEATNHRRFKAHQPTPCLPGVGNAVDLEKLRRSKQVNAGVDEVVLSAMPMAQLRDARFVGFTAEHADISSVAPTKRSVARDDRTFAAGLEPAIGHSAMMDYLKNELE
jgi:hypothetical protein